MTALPQRVDPRRLAAAGGELDGFVELAGMPRLADYLLTEERPPTGQARLTLGFEEDAQRRVLMRGRLRARLTLQCQRCLQGLDWPLDAALRLAAVSDDDAAAQVPRDYDPVVLDAAGLDVPRLAEDELILALPVIARCEDDDCPHAPRAADTDDDRPDAGPFAVLHRLREEP